jgi:diguanylate cyclase (GGDEF)-like protein
MMSDSAASVLVVSEDPKIRELARTAIADEGLEPILCGDGDEAMESARNQEKPIKLVALESFLPKKDGFEVVSNLQESAQTKEIPILMFIGPGKASSQASTEVQNLSAKIRLHADNYLQKPFDQKEIKGIVHSMVKYYRAHGSPHPITGLPGHPQIEQEVFNRLSRGETFVMLCMDINHFRPFNDHYGTEKGNEIIRTVHQITQKAIRTVASGAGESAPFLAHVDGDDFVLLISEGPVDEVRKFLQDQFQAEITKFYSESEIHMGFFIGKSREEQKQQIFPLMSLSTVGLSVSLEKFVHYGQLVSQANDLMRQAKVGTEILRVTN